MQLARLARTPLCELPTPLQRATRLEAALGKRAPRIHLKRDDLTGLAFGGNKGRKLEYLVADALAQGATTLVSEGAIQSNHARMTAAAAAARGLNCVLVLDARHGEAVVGNLLLDRLFGAEVRVAPDAETRAALFVKTMEDLCAAGERPYAIPTGGSVPLGAAGYVAAVEELAGQLLTAGEAPRRLYAATGSLGTQAGLVVGARAFSASYEVYGVAVSHPAATLRERGVELANETAALIGLPVSFGPDDICVDGGFVGDGYGVGTPGGLEAIQLLARTEAVLLDPVYSGKAMAALLAHIRAGEFSPDESVVFLHTGGGPSLFAHGEALLATNA
ncbi:MAG: D-cysteine desulfhydrase family protein [Thermomicrobiales bacterium]|nr:D-cysteine desulfhydrase family protein [Thermomicrobiales bacterium]